MLKTKMESPTIKCPFCRVFDVADEPGKAYCPECKAGFVIDDRVECIFVDLDTPRLPLKGTFCKQCGLIQGGYMRNCPFCGGSMDSQVQ